ncbi:MAG: peptidoglycan editing factor PgeF [Eubacteriales bacterium]|nr:peptidoglycan editing factor PgeF [Eubacteriales bacterium]
MKHETEKIVTKGSISCVTYAPLDELGFVKHGFALRTGGVSKGCYESLNLSFTRGDVKEDVDENFRRVAEYFGTTPDRMVSAYQTHTSDILRVGNAEAGCGVTKDRIYPDYDGLLTNEPGLMLTTSHADCTPLFFADPKHKAIAMTHSGWKGTAGGIGANTVAAMRREFGTDPGDIAAAIGPCICGDCYEVGPEVAEIFISKFGEAAFAAGDPAGAMLKAKDNGKFLLNQKAINVRILTDAGVRRENITVSELCTFERTDIFFSHRRMGEKRGNLRAFIMIDP